MDSHPPNAHGERALDRMDDYDANWLAEAVIRRFCAETGRADRQNVVVVVPEKRSQAASKSGVEKVLDAMLHTRRVKALKVERASIQDATSQMDGRDVNYAELWKSDEFVVFDETAVSLATIRGLLGFLKRSGRAASASGAIIDVGWAGRGTPPVKFFSLCCWDHLSEIR